MKVKCPRNCNNGNLPCPNSRCDHGQVPCRECGATGETDCRNCGGRGFIERGTTYEGCGYCGGRGEGMQLGDITVGKGKVTCSDCGGRKKIKCDMCDGTNHVTCPRCNGQGVVDE